MGTWYFPSAKGIGINGFNNIGEEFKDNPIQSLAKEICQNSLDTKLNPEYGQRLNKTTKVVFNEFWMNTKEFPGYESFLETLEDEYKFNSNYYKHDKTVPNFYQNAINCLKQEKIYCLRISDFNTTGLLGSDMGSDKGNHSPWCDLTKNAGVSDKPEGSGGSKGKGKFASFICSSLYTVFYSTYAMDELRATCGIARLSGYELHDGNKTIGEGYFEENVKIDENYTRNEYGTDIYIIGFRNDYENWKDQIIASIIDNFFAAIIREDLIVEVGENILSSKTIDTLIKNEKVEQYLNPVTKKYYEIMTANPTEIIVENYSMFEENDLILKIKANADETTSINTVAAIRTTGMKILDLKNLPKLGFYHGILEMKGNKVNDYFRKLENASHNKWSPSRGENMSEAKNKIEELKNFVKNTIKKYMTQNILDEIDAEGVGEFLPDEDEFVGEEDKEKQESINNETIKTIEIKQKQVKSFSTEQTADQGEEDIELNENGEIVKTIHKEEPDPTPGPHPNPIDEPQAKFSEVTRKIIPEKIRTIADGKTYQLILTTRENEKAVKLEFSIYGESSNEKANIKTVQAKKINKILNKKVKATNHKNMILLENVSKEATYVLEFEIETDDIWPLEVKVYGSDK